MTTQTDMEMVENGKVNLAFQTEENQISDSEVITNSNSCLETDEQKYKIVSDGFLYDQQTGDIIITKKPLREDANACAKAIAHFQNGLTTLYQTHQKSMTKGFGFSLLILYLAYVAYSLSESEITDESSMRLLVGTIFGLLLLLFHLCQAYLKPVMNLFSKFNAGPKNHKIRIWIRWSLYVVSTAVTVTLIITLVALDTPKYLSSLGGLVAVILICFATSHSPIMIQWHPVFWGVSFQFYIAVMILKTRWGYDSFNWLGDRIREFVAYSDEGAKFVFGDISELRFQDGTTLNIKSATLSNGSSLPISSLLLSDQSYVTAKGVYSLHFVAFAVLPAVIFFGAFLSIMSHLGVITFVIRTLGGFLSFCLGTTPVESVNAAANILLGLSQAPLLIKEYIGRLTSSELHAVMTGAFACIPSNMLGIFVGIGIPAQHLLAASFISAPAALAISKITYPEVEVPVIKSDDYTSLGSTKKGNLVEAAITGAAIAGKVCVAIAVNMIAIMSLLRCVNATLTWFGERADVENLTFEFICSYALYPIALLTGTVSSDCRKLAELIGIKTFANDFLAFSKLSDLISNRKIFEEYMQQPNNTWHSDGDDIYLHERNNMVLANGVLEPRSEVIAVYALCGLTNFGAMGVLLGCMTALAPNRFPTMSRLIFRAMIAGNIANIANACIAGLLYEDF